MNENPEERNDADREHQDDDNAMEYEFDEEAEQM